MTPEAGFFCATCGYLSCVCKIRLDHKEHCRLRNAILCPVGIACDHGYDVCLTCDPCTCGGPK